MILMTIVALAIVGWHWHYSARSKTDFPDGFDAVQAAPRSHLVLFENSFVRVLQVAVEPGMTVPWHHHRWPSLNVSWDTGGHTGHFRYHNADGTVRDIPSKDSPIVEPGRWRISWMAPEPMHSVEDLDTPDSAANEVRGPHGLRIEIKNSP